MNTYLVVEHVLKLSFQDLAVVLFDRYHHHHTLIHVL